MHLLTRRLMVATLVMALGVLTVLRASAQDGSAAYNFLNITSSAKIYALGGVNVSLVGDDISTTDQNPALLDPEMSGQVALGYMHYVGGSNFAGVRYGHSAGEHGAWSAHVRYFGYGAIKETLPDGSVVGSFSPSDIAFGASYSHDITDRLRGGATLRVLSSQYADFSALAIATDLGINWYDADRDASLSLVVANLGGQVKRFTDRYDRMPIDVRVGWSQSFGTFPVRFSVTAWNLTRWHLPYTDAGDGTASTEAVVRDGFMSNLMRHLVFGADLISSDKFYLALGYNYKSRTDMSTYSRSFVSGWSLGGGFKGRGFGVDVALAKPHTGATTLLVNLNLSLSELIN